ncbi:uncharacterized protein isoform X6 [Salmo salar]|uniref:Uncharacterized protein isoform X6 n=1 Tax=Salmo salar TaxID=8030 RepID=A0ABM3DSF2_SALSA|nr:uncharacterized protein LOC106583442 isoform X6 [Salmo salar]
MKGMFLWWSLAILLPIQIFALELEMLDYKSEHFTCSKGLSNCTVKAGVVVLIPECPVDHRGLEVQPVLCCRQGTACRPCIHIHLDIHPRNHQTASYVNVCYNVPELQMDMCKILEFTVIPAALDGQATSKVWWNKGDKRSHRSISCPFRNHTELLQRNVWENVSVSVVQGQMNSGGTMLSWNLTAPCRVEAEVWPCQKEAGLDMDRCTELVAFRQRLSDDIWRENSRGHWLMPGVFEDVILGHDLCVMVKVKGKNSALGPFCPIDSNWWHWRWSLLVLLSLMLAVLAAICLYFLHGKLKRWAWEWYQKECGRLANRGHIVLLSPPDVDGSVSELVCELGSSLCAQGFSVSVDLWSRAELCSLGPLPWLHSQLQHLDSHGVRAILVLTQAAWERTEDWVRQWDQQGQQGKDIVQGVEKEEGGEEMEGEGEDKGLLQGLSSPYADVFSAALSCIKADHKLGCAGERFLLVHFEAHSVKPPSSERGLPELFQGLPMFHLPSQSQGLLAELAMGPTGPEAGIGGYRV